MKTTTREWWRALVRRLKGTTPVMEVQRLPLRVLPIDQHTEELARLRSALKKLAEEKAVYKKLAETLQAAAQADTEHFLHLRDELNQAVLRAQVAEDELREMRNRDLQLAEADRQSVINLMRAEGRRV